MPRGGKLSNAMGRKTEPHVSGRPPGPWGVSRVWRGGRGADMYILNVTICLELEGVGSSYLGLPTDALLPIIIFTQTLQMPQHLFFG